MPSAAQPDLKTESNIDKQPIDRHRSFGKILIVIVILTLIIFITGAIYFFSQKQTVSSLVFPTQPVTMLPTAIPTPTTNIFQNEDFSIVIPEGWAKSQSPLPGSLLTIYKINEDHAQDPNAQKINFKSYIAVSFDKTQGRTRKQLISLVKQSLSQLSPNSKFGKMTEDMIDGQPADLGELEINQQDVDYKVLIALIMKDDKFFTVSANTTAKKWHEYKDLLYQTVKSFKFKITAPSPT